MVSPGRFLRSERERQGLTLADIANRTKISLNVLRELEEDRVDEIPSAFLYRNFVRQITAALNIDYRQIETSVSYLADSVPSPLMPGENTHRLPIRPLRPQRTRASAYAKPALSLLAALILCTALYTSFYGIKMPSFGRGPRQSSEPVKLAPVQNVVSGGFAVPGQKVLLKIAAIEKTWLSIDKDGRHIYSGVLKPHETKALQGQEMARIRTGNAGGLTVTFNGTQLGKLGDRGQIRTVLFTGGHFAFIQPELASHFRFMPALTITE